MISSIVLVRTVPGYGTRTTVLLGRSFTTRTLLFKPMQAVKTTENRFYKESNEWILELVIAEGKEKTHSVASLEGRTTANPNCK